ncbi:Uncharacterised protein [Mycobacteroides abscessus subsp. abscessus]|nr:Uncharacterised protein [Mycobacteroides abscessus subsp. abscessus]
MAHPFAERFQRLIIVVAINSAASDPRSQSVVRAVEPAVVSTGARPRESGAVADSAVVVIVSILAR